MLEWYPVERSLVVCGPEYTVLAPSRVPGTNNPKNIKNSKKTTRHRWMTPKHQFWESPTYGQRQGSDPCMNFHDTLLVNILGLSLL